MIDPLSIMAYRGPALSRGDAFLYMSPIEPLLPYIANYTISCPTVDSMPDAYTILPTASTTLVYAIAGGRVVSGLRGVNTRAVSVGAYAKRQDMLVLIEFHPGGLYPFTGVPQRLLLDRSEAFHCVDGALDNEIAEAIDAADDIASLLDALNSIFLSRLYNAYPMEIAHHAMMRLIETGGRLQASILAKEMHYSEKQLTRLFSEHIGAGIKTFSRIVRVNRAMRLMEQQAQGFAHIATEAGYFDHAHFIHDFKALCGITPSAFMDQRMSVFYNDPYKL